MHSAMNYKNLQHTSTNQSKVHMISNIIIIPGVSDMVKETWKYAAAEICDMLNRVKDHAGDTKALETKINKMVTSMNQQSDTVNQLNKKIKELEEVIIARVRGVQSDV